MKLPNGERAIVDIQKLQGYCLNLQHFRGRNKARVFAAFGVWEANAEELRTALLTAASNTEARLGVANVYGQRYIVDFDFVRHGRQRGSAAPGLCESESACLGLLVVMYYEEEGSS